MFRCEGQIVHVPTPAQIVVSIDWTCAEPQALHGDGKHLESEPPRNTTQPEIPLILYLAISGINLLKAYSQHQHRRLCRLGLGPGTAHLLLAVRQDADRLLLLLQVLVTFCTALAKLHGLKLDEDAHRTVLQGQSTTSDPPSIPSPCHTDRGWCLVVDSRISRMDDSPYTLLQQDGSFALARTCTADHCRWGIRRLE